MERRYLKNISKATVKKYIFLNRGDEPIQDIIHGNVTKKLPV
jgi:hypothetical protein